MAEVDSELVLTADAHAAKAARSMLGDCAGSHVGGRVLSDAQLMVTELVANCFVHGRLSADERIVVHVSLTPAALRLEVRNPGVAGAIEASPGHGLEMVRRLSASWGVMREQDTCVWAEIARAA